MTFDELGEVVREYNVGGKKHLMGLAISNERITIVRELLRLLRDESALMRERFFMDGPLSAEDNITKGMWVANHLVFFLTDHYVVISAEGTKKLPTEVVQELLSKCDTSCAEIIALIEYARKIEVDEMLNLGATEYAIDRALR